MSYLSFPILAFFTNFYPLKSDMSGNNSPKWTIFGIFNELMSTQNVNVAHFARNVDCDFFGTFSNTVQARKFQYFYFDPKIVFFLTLSTFSRVLDCAYV